MPFQNLFKELGESECVSLWNFFWNWNQKRKSTTSNLSFHQFSPCANVNLHRPSPTSCPLKCSLWYGLSHCGQSCKVPHSQRQVEKWGYCEDNFRSEYKPKPKTGSAWNCLAVLILPLGFTWRDTTLGPTQMINNHDVLHQEECKVETEFIISCKALHTWKR